MIMTNIVRFIQYVDFHMPLYSLYIQWTSLLILLAINVVDHYVLFN